MRAISNVIKEIARGPRLSEENSAAFHETAKTVQYIDESARNEGNLVSRFNT